MYNNIIISRLELIHHERKIEDAARYTLCTLPFKRNHKDLRECEPNVPLTISTVRSVKHLIKKNILLQRTFFDIEAKVYIC